MGRNVTHPPRHFFDAADLHPLARFDDLYEIRGLNERLGSSRVEPGEAPAALLNPQHAALQVFSIDVRDLELASRRGRELARNVEHLVVVEIKTGDGESR